MRKATISSVCECQAKLFAELNEARQVRRGWARRGVEASELAPAHTIGADPSAFSVGWFCPFCGRNTLRSFDAGMLVWVTDASPTDDPPSP